MKNVHAVENKVDGIVLVSEEAQTYLHPRQEIAYREFRRDLAEWMLSIGKNPKKADGYAHETVKTRMNRLDLFYRFIWDREGRYVQDLTPQDADAWMRWLARQDYNESTKNQYQKAAKTLFKWKREAPRVLAYLFHGATAEYTQSGFRMENGVRLERETVHRVSPQTACAERVVESATRITRVSPHFDSGDVAIPRYSRFSTSEYTGETR